MRWYWSVSRLQTVDLRLCSWWWSTVYSCSYNYHHYSSYFTLCLTSAINSCLEQPLQRFFSNSLICLGGLLTIMWITLKTHLLFRKPNSFCYLNPIQGEELHSQNSSKRKILILNEALLEKSSSVWNLQTEFRTIVYRKPWFKSFVEKYLSDSGI